MPRPGGQSPDGRVPALLGCAVGCVQGSEGPARTDGEGEAGTPADDGVEAAQCNSEVRWGLGWGLRAQVRVGRHSERERERKGGARGRGRKEEEARGSEFSGELSGTSAPAVLDL